MKTLRLSFLSAILSLTLTTAASAQTYKVLSRLAGNTNGFTPSAGLTRDASGNLYGVTYDGGDLSCYGANGTGCGVVFKLSASGQFTVVHTFTGSDGAAPAGDLLLDSQGNLYGVTTMGGAIGYGAFIKIDSAGNETVLHSFAGPEGASPSGPLTRDAQGNFYGVADGGSLGFGAVYKMDPSGNVTVIHNFLDFPNDGAGPVGGVLFDAQGNLYGVTLQGGTYKNGTIYKIDSSGNETVLYNFTGASDGSQPSSLIRDAKGNLYGTAGIGGAGCDHLGCGVVFKLSTAGKQSVLFTFKGYPSGGADPVALFRDSSGNLCGTTFGGGTLSSGGYGTIFALSPSGQLKELFNLTPALGALPGGRLISDQAGKLYGVTSEGGDLKRCNGVGCGVIFEFKP